MLLPAGPPQSLALPMNTKGCAPSWLPRPPLPLPLPLPLSSASTEPADPAARPTVTKAAASHANRRTETSRSCDVELAHSAPPRRPGCTSCTSDRRGRVARFWWIDRLSPHCYIHRGELVEHPSTIKT